MTGKDIAALIGHALRLAPALLRRDPIFRYAAIGALMALVFLMGRAAQDWAGPGPIPATPPSAIESPSATGPAAPGLPQPAPATAPAIGRSGGYRMMIAFRGADFSVFLFGFAKSDESNVDDRQLAVLRRFAASWLSADAAQIKAAVERGELIEVRNDKQGEEKTG